MTPEEHRRRVDSERGTGTIRTRSGGFHLIPCSWAECDTPARREHMHHEAPDAQDNIRFRFFCSGRHRVMWINSPHDMGNLPSGSKGLIL